MSGSRSDTAAERLGVHAALWLVGIKATLCILIIGKMAQVYISGIQVQHKNHLFQNRLSAAANLLLRCYMINDSNGSVEI